MNHRIAQSCGQNSFLVKQFCDEQHARIEQLAHHLAALFADGGQLLTAGAGLLHLVARLTAAQFSYRLGFERPALPAVCLGSDEALAATMASAGEYEYLCLRHCRMLSGERKLLLLFGDGTLNPALVRVRDELLDQEQQTVLLSGSGSKDPLFCDGIDICLDLKTDSRARQIELMQFAGHLLCELVEAELFHC